ncbi:MAG: hypothetical protein R6X12_05440 [bacterium]
MRYCVRIAKLRDQWRLFTLERAEDVIDAAQLVIDVPEFVGLLQPGGPLPRAAIVAPSSNSGRVVLTVDDGGRLQLIGCPHDGDDAELAMVMGDLLSIGGRLWRQPYASVAGPFEQQLGVPLENWISDRVGDGWAGENFQRSVERGLRDGRFPVVIVARRVSTALLDMLNYMRNMNIEVSVVGYEYIRSGGIEMVAPVQLEGQAVQQDPEPAVEPVRSVPLERPQVEQRAPVVNVPSRKPIPRKARPEPPANAGVSPGQQKILDVLAKLDDLGLQRRGLEFFVPGRDRLDDAKAAIALSVDANRWPFPKPEEVVVVVDTGADQLAGFLKLSPEEIQEFLDSLPRVQRKENRGALLLLASSLHEAEQLVNELRALKEVAVSGV